MTATNVIQSLENNNRDNELESQEVLKSLSFKLSISSSNNLNRREFSSAFDCVTSASNTSMKVQSMFCFRSQKRNRDLDDSMLILKRATPITDEDDDEDDYFPESKKIRSCTADFEGREDKPTVNEMRSWSPNSPLLWDDFIAPTDDEGYLLLPEISSCTPPIVRDQPANV